MSVDWHNVSKREPCPICGHDSWCSVSNNGVVCVCRRKQSPYPAKSGIGWIHRLKEREGFVARAHGNVATTPSSSRPPRADTGAIGLTRRDDEGVVATVRSAVATRPTPAAHYATLPRGEVQTRLCRYLTREIGLPDEFLREHGVRWDAKAKAAAFPMRDAGGSVTGIRYRELKTGRKWAYTGSKEGLFYVPGFIPAVEEIAVCEGPTDMIAALSVGVFAVGRASCLTGSACVAQLKQFLRDRHVKRVSIVADNDPPKPRGDGTTWRPGIDGARKLARDLGYPYRIVLPFPKFKDLRDWYAFGGMTQESFRRAAAGAMWEVGKNEK